MDSAVAGFGRVRQSLSVTSLGFRTLLSTAKCYRFDATLTNVVSGVITPAGSAQFSGYAPQIMIPKYTCALPAGGIDPGYRLVLSDTERILPVCNHFGFYIQIERIVPRAAQINSKRQLYTNQPDLLGTHRGNTTQAKHSRQCYN